MNTRHRFWSACRDASAWGRAARLGLPVGVAQVALNQGDHWISGTVSLAVIAKSILSPSLSFLIAFVSAAATRADAPSLLPSHE